MQELEMLQRGYSSEQMLGRKALNEGRPEEAARHFRNAVEQRPDATVARTNLVLALKRSGQLDAARREAMIAVELEPHSAQARFALAEILLAGKDYGEAILQLQAAVEEDPDHKTAQFNLAQLLRGTGQLEQALPHYGRARELDHQMVRATHGQAVTLVWLGRFDEALASVQQALGWSPDHPDLVLLRSRLLATIPDDSVRDGREALDLALWLFDTEQSVSAAETVAMAYAEIGRFDAAAAWQRAALVGVVNSPRGRVVDLVQYRLDLYDRRLPCKQPWLRGETFCPFPTERPTQV
jgi:tetratricopeptide (TPR) repeat protein